MPESSSQSGCRRQTVQAGTSAYCLWRCQSSEMPSQAAPLQSTKRLTEGLLRIGRSWLLETDCCVRLQATRQMFTLEARNVLRRALTEAAGSGVSGVAIEGVRRAGAGIRVALTVATDADVLAAQRLVRQLQVRHTAHALPGQSLVLSQYAYNTSRLVWQPCFLVQHDSCR